MKFKLGGVLAMGSHVYMFLKVRYFNHTIIFLLSSSVGGVVGVSGLQ